MQKKIIIFFSGAVLCLCVAGYWFNKPRTGVSSETTDASVTAYELYDKYSVAETEANKLYLDKVIEVSGEVDDITGNENNTIVLLRGQSMGGISCLFATKAYLNGKPLKKGMQVVIKGRCTGFNIDVNLVDCIIML